MTKPLSDSDSKLLDWFANCKSREWRLNNLYWVQNKQGEKVRFQLNWAQKELDEFMWPFMLVLKARQLGVTTYFAVNSVDQCIFYPNQRAAIIADSLTNAEEIFRTKVKYVWDHMADDMPQDVKTAIRRIASLKTEQGKKLVWSNESSIQVSTSMRSSTLNRLHISEFGKICAKYPEKAKEIVTGAINAVHVGQEVSIESTAEGREGFFFDFSTEAEKKKRLKKNLTAMDFQFFFFPWWKEPNYTLDGDVTITKELKEYFDKIEKEIGQTLLIGQRKWYAKKMELQQEYMKREYPSTPKEAFEASVEGAYFSRQMAKARDDGRIGSFPYVKGQPVYTLWDLGVNDENVVLFFQVIGKRHRFIDYHQATDEGFEYYGEMLKELAKEKGYKYGGHYLPHDIETRIQGKKAEKKRIIAEREGIKPIFVVPRVERLSDGIEITRSWIKTCEFDEENCSELIIGLDLYRKEWDDKLGCFKDNPRHDRFSHTADAFRQGAQGFPAKAAFEDPESAERQPPELAIPDHWPRWRSLKWGEYGKPYSVGWYAKSPDNKIWRYRELYGIDETPAELADLINAAEADEIKRGIVFRKNPAGKNIWTKLPKQRSVAKIFKEKGITWSRSNIDKHTYRNAWEHCNQALKDKSFKYVPECKIWIEEVSRLQRDWIEDDLINGNFPVVEEWMLSLLSRQIYEAQIKEPPPKNPYTLEVMLDDIEDEQNPDFALI